MDEKDRISQLEKEVSELKEVVENLDSKIRKIFNEEFQNCLGSGAN